MKKIYGIETIFEINGEKYGRFYFRDIMDDKDVPSEMIKELSKGSSTKLYANLLCDEECTSLFAKLVNHRRKQATIQLRDKYCCFNKIPCFSKDDIQEYRIYTKYNELDNITFEDLMKNFNHKDVIEYLKENFNFSIDKITKV